MERKALEPHFSAPPRLCANPLFFSFVPSRLRVNHSFSLRAWAPAFAGERAENPVLQPHVLPILAAMTANRHPPTRADVPIRPANLTKLTQFASGRIDIVKLSAGSTTSSHGVIRA